MTDLIASERAISFGPFRLVPTQRLLLEDDNPVRVGSRALDILTALVERPGELVGKDELMALVWRGTFVEEGNLKFDDQFRESEAAAPYCSDKPVSALGWAPA